MLPIGRGEELVNMDEKFVKEIIDPIIKNCAFGNEIQQTFGNKVSRIIPITVNGEEPTVTFKDVKIYSSLKNIRITTKERMRTITKLILVFQNEKRNQSMLK